MITYNKKKSTHYDIIVPWADMVKTFNSNMIDIITDDPTGTDGLADGLLDTYNSIFAYNNDDYLERLQDAFSYYTLLMLPRTIMDMLDVDDQVTTEITVTVPDGREFIITDNYIGW